MAAYGRVILNQGDRKSRSRLNCNPYFWDRQVSVNSFDPDQTAISSTSVL